MVEVFVQCSVSYLMTKVENWFSFMAFDTCIKYAIEYCSTYCATERLINSHYAIVFINRYTDDETMNTLLNQTYVLID